MPSPKFLLLSLSILAGLALSNSVRAQTPLGNIVATFPYQPSKVLSDPVRPRVYVADLASNSVAVIDTTTLSVVATIPVGSDPVDMSISMDGNTLYVANHGSTAAAVGVVDLNALILRTSFALPAVPFAIAAGSSGRVFVVIDSDTKPLNVLDGSTGAVLASTYGPSGDGTILQVSPDGTTLYEATIGEIMRYNVSGTTPALLQNNPNAGDDGGELILSHNGRYLCFPSGGGNSSNDPYTTFLFSAANLTNVYGTFNNGPYPGPLAFSPDDSVVYQTTGVTDPQNSLLSLETFNTQSFVRLDTVQVSLGALAGDSFFKVTSIVTDNTDSYLFVGESALSSVDGSKVGQVVVTGTGAGTLSPPLPIVSLDPATSSVTTGTGGEVMLTVSRTGDLSRKLVVRYAVKGSAKNGVDYEMLIGKRKLRPGKASAAIQIVPIDNAADTTPKKVKLVLVPDPSYQLGADIKAKIKIFPVSE